MNICVKDKNIKTVKCKIIKTKDKKSLKVEKVETVTVENQRWMKTWIKINPAAQ